MRRVFSVYFFLCTLVGGVEAISAQISPGNQEKELAQELSHIQPDAPPAGVRASFREALSAIALARGLPEDAAQRMSLVGAYPDYTGKQIAVVTYDVGWAEVTQRILLSELPSERANWERHLTGGVDWRLFDLEILPRSDATALLKTQCHPKLDVPIIKARPPFYNNVRNPSWAPGESALLLKGSAVLDRANNVCATGSIDLVTGEVHCNTNIACRVD